MIPASRPLRMIVHARFSTDEQRPTSLDDPIAVCRQFLDQSLPKGRSPTQMEIRDVRKPEISGEIATRPAINDVFERIANAEPAWVVADWLTSIDIPKAKWARRKE